MKLKVSALLLAMSFVTSVFAADPIDESLYSGVSVSTADVKAVFTIDGSQTDSVVLRASFQSVNFVLNRTFAAGRFATWVAPIAITAQGSDFAFYNILQMVKKPDGMWAVDLIQEKGEVKANTPYLIVATKDIERVRYFGTNLEKTEDKCITFENNIEGSDFVFDFCGTYRYIEWADNEVGSIYGFAAGDGTTGVAAGQFSRGAPGAKIRPMRAYLKYKGRKSKGAMKAAAGRVAVLDDFEDVELPSTIEVRIVESANATQGFRVGTMDTRTGEVTLDKWVDLRGRSLNRKPDVQGTYYNNGKKVIIK